MRSRARWVWWIERWPAISKEEMKGEMSSGVMAPMGVQLSSRREEKGLAWVGGCSGNTEEEGHAVCILGAKVVRVALSFKAP